MPNWVTHHVVVTGPEAEVQRFQDEIIILGEDMRPKLDFGRVIAMPEAFEKFPVNSQDEAAWTAWYGPDELIAPTTPQEALDAVLGMSRNLGFWLGMPWAKKAKLKTRKQLQEYLLKQDPKSKEIADRLERTRKNYGSLTSSDWGIRNWGTKWNSSHFDPAERRDGLMEFRFDTAWSPPEPIFWELSKLFPKLRWDIKSFDEGFLYAMKGLMENAEGSYDEVAPSKDFYEEVYGVPYQEPSEEG